MKPLILILLVCLINVVVSESHAQELNLKVSLIKAERSKDSRTETTTIVINADRLTYDKTYRGYKPGKPVNKEFELARKELESLRRLIVEKNLLVSDSLEVPLEQPGFRNYFQIELDINLGQKKSQIKIGGTRRSTELLEKSLYRNTYALLELIYAIIAAKDKAIGHENRGLIKEPEEN